MAKKQAARKNGKVKKPSQTVVRLSKQLDAGALAYRRLLADPCHAPLTSIPFAGTSSGYLYRTRTTVVTNNSNVASMVTLAPGYTFITNPNAGPVRNGPIVVWGTDNVADAVTNQTGLVPYVVDTSPNTSAATNSYRLVAGCIRVTYTGSEMAKAGLVYGGLTSSNPWGGRGLGPYNASGQGTVSIRDYMANASQSFVRLNGTHEVRWAPDAESLDFVGSNNGDNFQDTRSGGAVHLAVVGHPPGGVLTYEVICVWEVTPEIDRSNASGGALIPTPQAPKSKNTLNHVLSTIGDIAGFVVEGLGGPHTMARLAGNLASTYLPNRRDRGQLMLAH